MDDKELELQEKREKRRKRRVRNQVISYSSVVLFAIILVVCCGLGIMKYRDTCKDRQEVMESKQEAIENILSSEEEIIMSEPESTEEAVIELTPEEKLDEIVNAGIEVMPLEDKVAGLFVVTPESITGTSTAVRAGQGTQSALAKYAVGGMIYQEKNIQTRDQFAEMLKNTNLFTKYPIFLAIEEEGGRASKLASKGIGERLEGAAALGEAGNPELAGAAGEKLGETLKGLGINLNLAPVADVNTVENGYIGDRSYGTDPGMVGAYVTSFMQGMKNMGVSSCVKHFPGLGGNQESPYKGISESRRTREQFRELDFLPFQAAIDAGAEMIMVSTMTAPELTGNQEPCVFSEGLVTEMLRNEMGFQGVIITDALSMKSVSEYYDSEEAAIMAIKAGCDMILMPEDFEKAFNGVMSAVQNGTIAEERIDDALRRIYRIKYADKIQ